MKTIAALVPNKLGVSPGQRLRIEAWSKFLLDYGWKVEFYPFEDESLHEVFYSPGRRLTKMRRLLSCYARHAKVVVKELRDAECHGLFIYREATLVGPAFLERLAKRLDVPIIYDIDDPIFLPYKSPVNGWLSLLKFSKKTHSLFRMSDRIISINHLIGNYASRFNDSVSVVPNFVDTDAYRPIPQEQNSVPKIVWTGSVSTLQNLKTITDPMRRIQAKYGAPLVLISNGTTSIEGLALDQRQWTPEAEIKTLQECDVGIVPLLDLEWNPWKFYLKTIQYMAVGLPVIARRIGSNSEVIDDGVNGFLVETESEWFDRLSQLIEDRSLRRRMGEAARSKAVEMYSVDAQKKNVAQIFEDVYGGK